jgi:hypothetical protein
METVASRAQSLQVKSGAAASYTPDEVSTGREKMVRKREIRVLTPSLALGTLSGSCRSRCYQSGFSLEETMFVDKFLGMVPFLALGALGVGNLLAAIGALRGTRRAEELGEERYDLLRDQHERLELLREERKTLLDELERERGERLEAQKRVEQLMREHPHLELERELQRLKEELELEREGRTHNHRERQRLGEELEREHLARSGDQRNVQRLERDLRELQEALEEQQQALRASKRGLWTNLLRSNNH